MTTPGPHVCTDECVCALHDQPLVFWSGGNRHACQVARCPDYVSVGVAAWADSVWAILTKPCRDFELRA